MVRREASVWRFGPFEVDSMRPEVRTPGSRIELQDLPHRLLLYLLDRPGLLVTREELRVHLWPENHFIDFEHGLNTAIKKLRSALSDSAVEPRYIETVPRRGYIFKAEVHRESRRRPQRRWLFGSVAAVLAAAAILIVSTRSENVNPTVAVLPLEDLSPVSDRVYFANGLTETLITDLGRLGAFRVIARTSVVHYKGTPKTSHEIGRELNARWLVTGAVARAGNRIRITVQLVDATKDQNAWSETYERDERDVLALQDEVARAIARRVSSGWRRLCAPGSPHISSFRTPRRRTFAECQRWTNTLATVSSRASRIWRRRPGKTRSTRTRGPRWPKRTHTWG